GAVEQKPRVRRNVERRFFQAVIVQVHGCSLAETVPAGNHDSVGWTASLWNAVTCHRFHCPLLVVGRPDTSVAAKKNADDWSAQPKINHPLHVTWTRSSVPLLLAPSLPLVSQRKCANNLSPPAG